MTSATTPQLDSFTPDDLRAAVILIDYACEQGAFKGWDNINKAFTVRNRINAFVEQWESVSEPTPAPEEGNQ